jgi:hypothetical protein
LLRSEEGGDYFVDVKIHRADRYPEQCAHYQQATYYGEKERPTQSDTVRYKHQWLS